MFHFGEDGEFVWTTQEELDGILAAHRDHLEVFFFFFFVFFFCLFFLCFILFFFLILLFSDSYLGDWGLLVFLVLGT